MKNVLLLNLPFSRRVQRDYSCPNTVKAEYYWPPIDLLAFGAALGQCAKLSYVDCILEGIGERQLLGTLDKIGPAHIFTILSSITLRDDLEVLAKIKKEHPGVKIWASGDVITFGRERYGPVDFYVRDFTNSAEIQKLFMAGDNGGDVGGTVPGRFSIGICPHELVLGLPYSMPYSLQSPMTVVLTNYGCQFKCKFCNSNNLGFKKRDIGEVMEDLKHAQSVGVREVFFRDFTFAIPYAEELCDRMVKEGITLAWSCETRVDVVNRRLLKKMKDAGCYLVFYGVESGDDRVLEKMRKGFGIARAVEAVRETKEAGIETLASFIFGLPGEDVAATTGLIYEVDPDYLSVNLLAPRLGSAIREDMQPSDGAGTDCLFADEGLIRIRNDVEKKFYLRPMKMARYAFLGLRSPTRLMNFIRNAFGIIRRWRTQTFGWTEYE